MIAYLNGEFFEVEMYNRREELAFTFPFRGTVRGERHARKLIELALEGGAYRCLLNRVRRAKGQVTDKATLFVQIQGVPERKS